jgi:hypothetical protein
VSQEQQSSSKRAKVASFKPKRKSLTPKPPWLAKYKVDPTWFSLYALGLITCLEVTFLFILKDPSYKAYFSPIAHLAVITPGLLVDPLEYRPPKKPLLALIMLCLVQYLILKGVRYDWTHLLWAFVLAIPFFKNQKASSPATAKEQQSLQSQK